MNISHIYIYVCVCVICSFGDPVSQRGCHCTGGGPLEVVRDVPGACIAG